MIVKNEAPVITRCLASVRPFIDHWVIVDTGSTDGTQDIVRDFLRGVPGSLHERPWRNFAHNRNEALELARPQADYVLFIDADEQLRVPEGFAWPALSADGYMFTCRMGDCEYLRNAMIAARVPWRWEGVLHEFLAAPRRALAAAARPGDRCIARRRPCPRSADLPARHRRARTGAAG